MLVEQTFEGRNQNLKHAEKLLSIYSRQIEVLDKHRGKGQRKMTANMSTLRRVVRPWLGTSKPE